MDYCERINQLKQEIEEKKKESDDLYLQIIDILTRQYGADAHIVYMRELNELKNEIATIVLETKKDR